MNPAASRCLVFLWMIALLLVGGCAHTHVDKEANPAIGAKTPSFLSSILTDDDSWKVPKDAVELHGEEVMFSQSVKNGQRWMIRRSIVHLGKDAIGEALENRHFVESYEIKVGDSTRHQKRWDVSVFTHILETLGTTLQSKQVSGSASVTEKNGTWKAAIRSSELMFSPEKKSELKWAAIQATRDLTALPPCLATGKSVRVNDTWTLSLYGDREELTAKLVKLWQIKKHRVAEIEYEIKATEGQGKVPERQETGRLFWELSLGQTLYWRRVLTVKNPTKKRSKASHSHSILEEQRFLVE